MKKPTEPKKPWPPQKPWFNTQVREKIGPVNDDDWDDEPYYPEVTIETIETFAKEHGIEDPRSVTLNMHPSAHTLDMFLVGNQTITQEMRDEANAEYQSNLKKYNEELLPSYEKAKAKYEEDLRAYYKWQHDRVGKR